MTIQIREELPESVGQGVLEQEAVELAGALLHSLPGIVFDLLAAELLDKVACRLRVRHASEEPAEATTKYVCAHCGKHSAINTETWLDSGTPLVCIECGGETVVDLFTPEQRAALYRDAGGL